jgi:hypothetical protein
MSVYNKVYIKTELFVPRIDGTDFTTAEWAFLGTVDQNLSAADEVEFKATTYNNTSFTTKIQTGATSNYTLTLPVDDGLAGEALTTDGAGVLSWVGDGGFNQSLNTTDNAQFVDLNLTGNLTVSGTTTLVETTNTEIKDNIILLNNGEAGVGIGGGSGIAGLEIERGSLLNTQILFDETTDKWTLGTTGAIGTTRYIIPEIADVSQTQGAIPGYDANGRLSEVEGITSAEVNQLQNIDTETITNTQWSYLGASDQGIATTDNVTFNDVVIDGSTTIDTPIVNSVSSVLTADPNPITRGINVFDTSSGVITCTLPDSAASIGMKFTIHLKTAGFNLNITRAGSDTIEGNTTLVLNIAGQHVELYSIGDTIWTIS